MISRIPLGVITLLLLTNSIVGAQETRPEWLERASEAARRSRANDAAFQQFYCTFDVEMAGFVDEKALNTAQFGPRFVIGSGAWAQDGPRECYEFRQSEKMSQGAVSSLLTSYQREGMVLDNEAMLRSSGFEMRIRDRCEIMATPGPYYTAHLDPRLLFHIVDRKRNTNPVDLLQHCIEEQANSPNEAPKIRETSNYLRFDFQSEQQRVGVAFQKLDDYLPRFVAYSTLQGRWATWAYHVVRVEHVPNVGSFPQLVAVENRSLWSPSDYPRGDDIYPRYAVLWRLTSFQSRKPTEDEMTLTTHDDFWVQRLGIYRFHRLNRGDRLTPDSLADIYRALQFHPTDK